MREAVSSDRQSDATPRTTLGHTSIRYNRYRELTPRVINLPECEFDRSAKPAVVVQYTRMYLMSQYAMKCLGTWVTFILGM
jgi:hypothetical protein